MILIFVVAGTGETATEPRTTPLTEKTSVKPVAGTFSSLKLPLPETVVDCDGSSCTVTVIRPPRADWADTAAGPAEAAPAPCSTMPSSVTPAPDGDVGLAPPQRRSADAAIKTTNRRMRRGSMVTPIPQARVGVPPPR